VAWEGSGGKAHVPSTHFCASTGTLVSPWLASRVLDLPGLRQSEDKYKAWDLGETWYRKLTAKQEEATDMV